MEHAKSQKEKYTALPATDSTSAIQDIQSVSLVEHILSTHGAVIPNLQKNDKTPNTDGTVTIYDDEHRMLGKIEVQVKTFNGNNDLKFSCPTSTLAYCEDIQPMLWFFVDNTDEKVYWLYIDCNYLSSIEYRNLKTKRVTLLPEQFFSISNKSYIDEWRRIALEEHEMRKRYATLKADYDYLSNLKNIGLGSYDENFMQIHRYLDELNKMYDINFPIIKKVLYPGMWKMGIAYSEYSPNRLSYALYPIVHGINDTQIKKFKDNVFAKVSENSFVQIVDYCTENPIMSCPIHHARMAIKESIEQIIKTDAIDLTCSEFLMIEYVFAVIDRIWFKLSLKEAQESYSIKEIKHGLQFYAPIWLDEQYKDVVKTQGYEPSAEKIPRYYIDRNNFAGMKKLRKRVEERIQQGEKPKSCILAATDFNIRTFTRALDELSKKYIVIKRPYKMQQFNRATSLVVNSLSKEAATYNMEKILSNLPTCYDAILKRNFTGITNDISLLYGADLLLLNYNLKDCYTYDDAPALRQYYFQCKNYTNGTNGIKVVDSNELEQYPFRFGQFENEQYKLIRSAHSMLLNTLYTKTPLLNLIKELLGARLEDYFNI